MPAIFVTVDEEPLRDYPGADTERYRRLENSAEEVRMYLAGVLIRRIETPASSSVGSGIPRLPLRSIRRPLRPSRHDGRGSSRMAAPRLYRRYLPQA